MVCLWNAALHSVNPFRRARLDLRFYHGLGHLTSIGRTHRGRIVRRSALHLIPAQLIFVFAKPPAEGDLWKKNRAGSAINGLGIGAGVLKRPAKDFVCTPSRLGVKRKSDPVPPVRPGTPGRLDCSDAWRQRGDSSSGTIIIFCLLRSPAAFQPGCLPMDFRSRTLISGGPLDAPIRQS